MPSHNVVVGEASHKAKQALLGRVPDNEDEASKRAYLTPSMDTGYYIFDPKQVIFKIWGEPMIPPFRNCNLEGEFVEWKN